MTHHSITRTARGRIDSITGTCNADDCPREVVDDDSIEYVCPDTGDVIVTVDTTPADSDPANQPATTDDLRDERRRRRRRR